MKKSKSGIAGLLALLLLILLPSAYTLAEEWDYGDDEYYEDDSYYEDDEDEEESEEPIPESYYYPIESNDIEGWPEGPMIESASAVVMDLDTGTFLYSKQATEKQYPASITKIMTTLLLIENCNLNDTITFSGSVYDLEEGSSHIGIEPGEKMTLRDCAYAILLASANDAAVGVAEYIGGSISGFADMMNEKAAELGCVNTHFSNPHGLYSDDHYTCAHDMALIAQAAYENETFREIVGTEEYTIPKTNVTEEERVLTNHHQMLNSDSDYYEEWCTGGKTGYTSQCLNTLVTFAEKDDKRLVSVVMRVNGSGKAYLESTDILNYGFDNFYEVQIRNSFSGVTFYEIMGLGYVGTAEEILPSAWKRTPFEKCRVHLTLPNDASQDQITYEITEEKGNARVFGYAYNGQPVGSASGIMNTPVLPVATTSLAAGADQSTTAASGGSTQMEGLDEVLDQTVEFLDNGYNSFMDFAVDHTWLVLGVGAILIILLIVLIVVLFFRSTADARIRKKRRQEEEEMKKREEEIEQMTTEEIEEELREAMQEEERRKQEELDAKAEAEKAAREEEEMEWKAQETERLIDELERERQERKAEGKNDKDTDTGDDHTGE